MNTTYFGVLLVLGLAAPAMAQDATTRPAAAPPVHRTFDARTGIEVITAMTSAGEVTVTAADAAVSVRKTFARNRSTTVLASRGEELTLVMEPGRITLSGASGTLVTSRPDEADMERMASLLQSAPVVQRARRLLATLEPRPDTFAGNALVLTRAFLELGTGSSEGLLQHKQWARAQATRPRMLRASYGQKTTGECWDVYALEGIEIANDILECRSGLKWYQVTAHWGCDAIYVVRSELAMFWLIGCNGGIPFKG